MKIHEIRVPSDLFGKAVSDPDFSFTYLCGHEAIKEGDVLLLIQTPKQNDVLVSAWRWAHVDKEKEPFKEIVLFLGGFATAKQTIKLSPLTDKEECLARLTHRWQSKYEDLEL